MRRLLKTTLGGGRHRGPRQLVLPTARAEAQHAAGGNDWFAVFHNGPVMDDEIPVARLMGHDSWRYL